MIDFTAKNVIVTGGNGAIGRAIGLAFARAGANVLLLGRNEARGAAALEMLADEGHTAEFHSVDLASPIAVESFFTTFRGSYKRLDVLINNAGGGESRGGGVHVHVPGDTRQSIEARWQDLAGSNLQSAYLMSAFAVPAMPDDAAIINISSTASVHGSYGLYGTMKAGMEGLTRSLAVELGPRRIRVNAISPGWIQTTNTLPQPADPAQAAWAANSSLLGRMGTVDEVAATCLFLASPLASFITGETLRVDGGLTIIDPTAESWREVR